MYACMYVCSRVLSLKNYAAFARRFSQRAGVTAGAATPPITESSRELGTGGARQSVLGLGQAMLMPSTLGFLSSCRPNNAGAAG